MAGILSTQPIRLAVLSHNERDELPNALADTDELDTMRKLHVGFTNYFLLLIGMKTWPSEIF